MNKDINESEQTTCSNCGGELKGKPMYLNGWCDDCLKLSRGGNSDSLKRIKEFAKKHFIRGHHEGMKHID